MSLASGMLLVVRSELTDQKIAHHEAAHAVTAECLSEGSVIEVSMDGGRMSLAMRLAYSQNGLECQASTTYSLYPPEIAIVAYAGEFGERLVDGELDPGSTKGDLLQAQMLGLSKRSLGRARNRAQSLVTENEDRIRGLATWLLTNRRPTGGEIRDFLSQDVTSKG